MGPRIRGRITIIHVFKALGVRELIAAPIKPSSRGLQENTLRVLYRFPLMIP